MEFTGSALMILIPAICILFFHYLNRKSLATNWPVVGMFPSLFLNDHRIHNWLTYLLSNNGGTFVFKGPWFTNLNTLLLTSDPANIRHIFATNFSNYPKGPEFNEVFDVLGDGIFNADSDSWKFQRKLALKLISQEKFSKHMQQATQRKVESGLLPFLEHVLQENLVVDLQDMFKRLAFDMSIIHLLGSDPCSLSTEFSSTPCMDAMDDIEEAIFYRQVVPTIWWKLQRLLGVGIEGKHKKGTQCLDQFITSSITRRRNEMNIEEKEEEKGVDLLRSYLEEDEVSGSKSDKFWRDTVLTFMGAGTSTVSAALTWFFWLVSKNPEVETKIIEEIKSKAYSFPFSSQGNKVNIFEMESLKGLVYLHGAFCEALRLFPSVPFNHKRPVNPDILPSGHRVDSKTRIMPILYSVARMEQVWGKDCLEFKPERWIASDETIQAVSSNKFTAFSTGPRACIGKEITFAQMRVVAATILYNYHVEVVDSHSVSMKNSMVLFMKHGMRVRIGRRCSTGDISM